MTGDFDLDELYYRHRLPYAEATPYAEARARILFSVPAGTPPVTLMGLVRSFA